MSAVVELISPATLCTRLFGRVLDTNDKVNGEEHKIGVARNCERCSSPATPTDMIHRPCTA